MALLSDAVQQFVADVLNLPVGSLEGDGLVRALTEWNAPADLVGLAREWTDAYSQIRYSGRHDGTDIDRLIPDADRLLTELNRRLKVK